MKIWNGLHDGERNQAEIELSIEGEDLYLVEIGTSLRPESVCGTLYSYIVFAFDKDDAIDRARASFRKAIKVVRLNMKPHHLVHEKWIEMKDATHPDVKRAIELEAEATKASDNHDKMVALDGAGPEREVFLRCQAELALRYREAAAELLDEARKLREPDDTDMQSIFQRIVEPMEGKIGLIDKGLARATIQPRNRLMSVRYYDDGREDFNYIALQSMSRINERRIACHNH